MRLLLQDGYVWALSTILCCALLPASALAQEPFVSPTADELAMTSLPGYPGVPAFMLYRSEIADGTMPGVTYYNRIKILTEAGEKYANVLIDLFDSRMEGTVKAENIKARTIHPDGKIFPYSGHPYLRTTLKGDGIKVQEMVFTLPDVTVGSILEYTYTTALDGFLPMPQWILQNELFVRAERFSWRPGMDIGNGGLQWFSVLPPGLAVKRKGEWTELTAKDMPPDGTESFMAPAGSRGYRVLFYISRYRTVEEFWKDAGTTWSKKIDGFIDVSNKLKTETQQIVGAATTQDEKLRKIYAAVMTIENTDYTRAHDDEEDRAAGLKDIKRIEDIWSRKRGSSDEINDLFVGMARASGMRAYDVMVSDRSKVLFSDKWPTFEQFYNRVAIVNVDGKEQFFDPGSRYCPYGHLAWQHTHVAGLRQIDKSPSGLSAIVRTPGEQYPVNLTGRSGDLLMNEKGEVTGRVALSIEGAAALGWRHIALRGDNEALHKALESDLESGLPKTLELKNILVANLDDYEKPLMVTYDVHGTLGTLTGKRLLIPVDPFRSEQAASFPSEKRESTAYFSYPEWQQDALRFRFPKTLTPEAMPSNATFTLPNGGQYNMNFEKSENNILMRRSMILGKLVVDPKDYAGMRAFYQQAEGQDKENIIFKLSAVPE